LGVRGSSHSFTFCSLAVLSCFRALA
jgi:hypothetical protein